jgi:hypothetical protein
VQFHDNGTPDHLWVMAPLTDPRGVPAVKYVNLNSGKALAVQDESLADGAQIQQYDDTLVANTFLTPDHLWMPEDQGGGYSIIRNVLSNLVLGVDQMSTADSALIKQAQDNQTADHLWEIIPHSTSSAGTQCDQIRNQNSGLLLGVDKMSTVDSANVVQFADNGTNDHVWCEQYVFFQPRTKPVYKIFNVNSGKLLAVQNMLTSDGAQIQQFADTATADQDWPMRGVATSRSATCAATWSSESIRSPRPTVP